jgi:hypothetical protein
MATRENVLNDLIKLRRPLSELAGELAGFSWDCEMELVRLTSVDIVTALRKFLDGELSGNDIERWANLIECRDDIDYEGLSDLIFRLSNPEINGQLDPSAANEILRSLEG